MQILSTVVICEVQCCVFHAICLLSGDLDAKHEKGWKKEL